MRRGCSFWGLGLGARGLVVLVLVLVLSGCAAKTSATTDDASISTRVKIALLNDPQVGSQRLEVKTFQGVVTLSGTVRSQAEADQAIAAARRIKGVRDVKSELRIVTNPRS